jgi:hypothetical protein
MSSERFDSDWSSYQEACKQYDVTQEHYPRYTDQNHESHDGYFICNSGNEWVCLPCGTKQLTEKGRQQIETDKKQDEEKWQHLHDIKLRELHVMTESQRNCYSNIYQEYFRSPQSHDYYMSICFTEKEMMEIKSAAKTCTEKFHPVFVVRKQW